MNGDEISVEARIVAVASPSKVIERWEVSPIVVDRFLAHLWTRMSIYRASPKNGGGAM